MLNVLADRTYRNLFLAQVVALLGTGLATVALGLLDVRHSQRLWPSSAFGTAALRTHSRTRQARDPAP